MTEEQFTTSALLVSISLRAGNRQLSIRALLDTGATGYAFVNVPFARVLCNTLNIESSPLSRPKTIKAFNDTDVERITHGIYSCLDVGGHSESTAPLLITNLGKHDIILGLPWIEKHGVIIDARHRRLMFQAGTCHHPGALPNLSETKLHRWTSRSSLKLPRPIKIIDEEVLMRTRPSFTPTKILSRSRDPPTTNVWLPLQPVNPPKIKKKSPKVPQQNPGALEIKMIGAAPYLINAQRKDGLIFSASMREIDQLLD